MHQTCYGIPVVPQGDWICDVCLNFKEKGKYLRCPLCDKRGGAMKPSNIKADNDMFEALNPDFHQFLKSYATPDFIKEGHKTKYLSMKDVKDLSISNKDTGEKEDKDDSDSEFSENLYYDIQFIDENFSCNLLRKYLCSFIFLAEELVDQPKPFYLWLHLTCVLFIPELHFNDTNYMTTIIGIKKLFCVLKLLNRT